MLGVREPIRVSRRVQHRSWHARPTLHERRISASVALGGESASMTGVTTVGDMAIRRADFRSQHHLVVTDQESTAVAGRVQFAGRFSRYRRDLLAFPEDDLKLPTF